MLSELQISGVEYDPTTPSINHEQIEMLMMVDEDEGDSSAFLLELYDLFRTESEKKLSTVEAICAVNDVEALRKVVHFIGGSAGNIGIACLAGFYRAVEQAINEGRLTDVTQCAEPIQAAFTAGCSVFCGEFGISPSK
jgi:HPt (histidine-containing phosphotransfer) domain-containing protein